MLYQQMDSNHRPAHDEAKYLCSSLHVHFKFSERRISEQGYCRPRGLH